MTFSIGEAFDLLFAPAARVSQIATAGPDFQSRRWFRRPKLMAGVDTTSVELDDQQAAEIILTSKIEECLPDWQSGIKSPTPLTLDAERHVPPRMPYDVFAAAAYLIENAGIYHHLQPTKTTQRTLGQPIGPAPGIRHIEISHTDRNIVRVAAEAWVQLKPANGQMEQLAKDLTSDPIWPGIAPLFESWWIVFGGSKDEMIFDKLADDGGATIPIWWKHAWRLLAIADEAAKGTAFQFDISQYLEAVKGNASDVRWFELEVLIEHLQRVLDKAPMNGDARKYVEIADIATLSIARQAIVSVLPKVRTPAVGCTLRSLSHHLALLPAAGIARGRWTPNYTKSKPKAGSMPKGVMNLLLIPFPYSLNAESFEATIFEDVTSDAQQVPRFGYFDVNQHWIRDGSARPEAIITFVQALIETAQKQSPEIHGIVFPELSLDHPTFVLVREHIRKHLPTADILVSGVSSDSAGAKGNYVAAASFQASNDSGVRDYRETVREKHHRWKLERTQLKDYGLLGVLSPELSWWENIALQNRRVDFTVMRQDSVMAAMICEDLARVDPCQQIIRAIGPNLVVALLMDAPQLAERWPARYATVLAEDPGCAVLTLTSRGLMTRQHRLGIFKSNGNDRVVGLWRDDRNASPTALKCPYDAQAVLLTIVEETAEDISLDGRTDRGAKAWRYAGDVPVRIHDAQNRFKDILGEEDLACW